MRGSASSPLASLILFFGMLVLSSSAARAADETLEVRLRYDRTAAQPLTLLEQHPSTTPLSKQRSPALKMNEWRLKGEAADGTAVWSRRIPNPILVFVDELDPTAPPGSGHLTGRPQLLDQGELTAVVPNHPDAVRLSAYAPYVAPGGDEEQPEERWVGTCALEPLPSQLLPSPSPSSSP